MSFTFPFSFWRTPSTTLDGDAREFIQNWELSTGVIMPLTQRIAVNDWYRGMKGEGTTYGSNLLAIAKSNNARIYILIPLDDNNANASAYELDAVSNGVLKGTYTNFAGGDFTPQGVIGGATKFFNSGVAPSDYLQNDNSFAFYNRTLNPPTGYVMACNTGAGNIFGTILRNTGSNGYAINSGVANQTFTNTSYLRVQRTSSVNTEIYRDGYYINNQTNSSNSGTSIDVYTHARNFNNSVTNESSAQLCYYEIGMPSLTSSENFDLFTVIQRLQSNVIAGGRQIGIYVPPIDAGLYDIDALSFISAHETSTGLPMGLTQKFAIQGFVLRLKGIGTTNGTDIWTTAKSNGGRLWPLCPTDDTTANADGYKVELITASPLGEYVNFLPGDFTPTGAIGGAGKYFDTNTRYRQVNADLFGISVYARTYDTTNFATYIGSYAITTSTSAVYSTAIRQGSSDTDMRYAVNAGLDAVTTTSQPVGLFTAQRLSVGNQTFYINGVQVDSKTRSRIVSQDYNTYAHALNNTDVVQSESTAELALYCTNWRSMGVVGLVDFNEAIQWYQTNVITGGRNV
jgi:hypothetical protein